LIGIAAIGLLAFPRVRGAAGQQVREQVTVDAVQIRVVVSDASGEPVRDLSAADLELKIDGGVVPIDSLELESGNVEASQQGSAPGSAQVGPRFPRQPPASAFAIVVDESTTAIPVRKEALSQLLGFLEGDDAAERSYLVCSYRHGSLQLDQPWTDDSGKVRAVLRKLRDHPTVEFSTKGVLTSRTNLLEFQMMRGRLLTALMQVIAMFPDGPATRQLVLVTGGMTLASPLDIYETLVGDASQPERIGGRRSDGTVIVPDPTAMDTLVEPFRDGFELWSRAVGGVAARAGNGDLLAKAMERDIGLVPIATSAPDSPGYLDVERRAPKTSDSQKARLSAELSANQALWGLAKETGTGSVILAGKAGRGLAELGDRAVYVMSFRYRPPEAGRLHKIELATSRPGISLDYRRGFRVRSSEERVLDSVIAHLALTPEGPDPLKLAVSLSPSKTEGAPRTTMTLRYVPPDPGPSKRSVEIIAVGKAGDGGWTMPIRWSGEASATAGGVYEVTIQLGVEPSAYAWSIGLRDLLSSVDGYALTGSKKKR
jgi:VWFA-related protein